MDRVEPGELRSEDLAPLKRKGDLAELNVAADLLARGCRLSFPFGEDCDYDLIADFEGILHRVQVKYTESDGRAIFVRCRSQSLTKGRVRRIKRYTADMIDWIAVYDVTSDCCYYIDAGELGSGRSYLTLRLRPPEMVSMSGPGRKKLRGSRSRADAGVDHGASGTRTRALGVANAALFQLSYGPV